MWNNFWRFITRQKRKDLAECTIGAQNANDRTLEAWQIIACMQGRGYKYTGADASKAQELGSYNWINNG
jgi:hypothetical protein